MTRFVGERTLAPVRAGLRLRQPHVQHLVKELLQTEVRRMAAEPSRKLRVEHVHGHGARVMVDEFQILMGGMEDLHDGGV